MLRAFQATWRRRQQRQRRSSIARAARGVTLWSEPLEDRRLLSITTFGLPSWASQGPGPITNGQVENIPGGDPVIGAIHTVLSHPTNSDILYVGATNGGVWRTTNATSASPDWTPLIDQFQTLSIGAMEFDPTDATNQTIVVATGGFSSFGGTAGVFNGLLRTTDGGDTWTQLGQADLGGRDLSGVGPRGTTILVADNGGGTGGGGIFRSTDGGANFTPVTVTDGLTVGPVFDLVGDPGNPSRFYAGVGGFSGGIFRTDDGGDNWVKVTDAALNVLVGGTTNNIEFAVHNNAGAGTNAVYAGVINNGQLAGFFRSADQGGNWTGMDIPRTNEGGNPIGLQPRVKPGGQGGTHFSILADPTNANVVYVGGDRQPRPGPDGVEGTADDAWPNSVGANDFTGRLFRGDASVAPTGAAPSPQWTPLTHVGTAGGSAPHADSREMVMRPNGDLVEVDDGGIYRRTNPTDSTGDWFSLIGDIRITEMHDVAWDSVSGTIISGNQDTGTPEQLTAGASSWTSVSTADGGDVAVDTISLGGFSIRYTSAQTLNGFKRRTYDNTGAFVGGSQVNPALTVIGGGAALVTQFVTPVVVNAIDGLRLLIGGGNSLYESTDRAETLTEVAPGVAVTTFAYGGRRNGVDNADVLYVGSGNRVFVRTTAGGAVAAASALPAGATAILDVVMNPEDWMDAVAVDNNQVFRTTNAGATWTDITGDLSDVGLRTVEYVPGGAGQPDAILAGGFNGIARLLTNAPGLWAEFGVGLPNALVFDMQYSAGSDVLLAGTMGRGAWTVSNASLTLFTTGVLAIDGDADFPGQDDTFRLIRNADNPLLLDVFINNNTTVPTATYQLDTIQQINVNGLGGNDTLILDSSNGLITIDRGTRFDGGNGSDGLQLLQTGGDLQTSDTYSVGPSIGAGSSTITGDTGTQLVQFFDLEPVIDLVPSALLNINATAEHNAINYTAGPLAATGMVTIDNYESIELANKDVVTINAGVGDDIVNLNNPATPTGLDRLVVNGAEGDDVVTTLSGTPVSLELNGGAGHDRLDAHGAAGSVTLSGGTGDDTLTGGAGDDALAGDGGEDLLDARGGTNTVNGGIDHDTVLVSGTAGADTIGVTHVGTGLSITGGFSAGENTIGGIEAVRVEAGAGADDITITPGTGLSYTVFGGAPAGAPGDVLTVVSAGAVTYTPGPEPDSGSLNSAAAAISFDEIEALSISGGPAVVNGTNGADAITVIARDSSTHAGADGVRDFTLAINASPEILFLNTANLSVNALGGSDEVSLSTPAPNNAAWDVDVSVDAGPPAAASDRLIVETPGAAGPETATFTPSGPDAGTLNLSSLSSVISIAGTEQFYYDGRGDGDGLSVVGTGGDDVLLHTPGANDQAGSLQVNSLLAVAYQNLGAAATLLADGGAGSDTLRVDGTAANDAFVVGATGTTTLNARIPVSSSGNETLQLEGFAGDDAFTLVPPLSASPFSTVRINGGGEASTAGDRAHVVGTAGNDVFDISGQTVSSGGRSVVGNGLEAINLDAGGGTDELIYGGVAGVPENVNVIASTTAGSGKVSVPGVALYNFTNAEVLDANGNDGSLGDTDTLTFTGTNAPDLFEINLNAAATSVDPILRLLNAAGTATLLTLRSYTGFAQLNVNGLDGADVFNVHTGAAVGRTVAIDGGLPTAKQKQTDKLFVFYAPPRPRITHSAATQSPRAGLVDLLYDSGERSLVQYADIEDVVIRRE